MQTTGLATMKEERLAQWHGHLLLYIMKRNNYNTRRYKNKFGRNKKQHIKCFWLLNNWNCSNSTPEPLSFCFCSTLKQNQSLLLLSLLLLEAEGYGYCGADTDTDISEFKKMRRWCIVRYIFEKRKTVKDSHNVVYHNHKLDYEVILTLISSNFVKLKEKLCDDNCRTKLSNISWNQHNFVVGVFCT